jgi:hypothetical protein
LGINKIKRDPTSKISTKSLIMITKIYWKFFLSNKKL